MTFPFARRLDAARRPFEGSEAVYVVPPIGPPDEDPPELVQRLPALLEADREAIARELGAPIIVSPPPTPAHAQWHIGPAAWNPAMADLGPADGPVLHLDRARHRLASDGPDLDGVLETFAGLRNLARHPGGPLPVRGCHSLDEAIERVLIEVHDAWPSWRLRGKRWSEISRRHVWRVRGAADAGKAITAMQRWLAELDDLHTWVRPVQTQVVLPYGACVVDGAVVLTHVPWWTAGFAAGARPGWQLIGLNVRETWSTPPARPHSKPLLVARRLLSGAVGEARHLEARGPRAATARWTEVHQPPSGTPASWEVLPSGTGYLWIGAWAPGLGVEAVIDEAFEALADRPSLIVDLRGNGGGRLDMAHALRDRFLDRPRQLGWIRTTEPGGQLGAPRPLHGEPSDAPRWTRPVRFLTSPLSYSSSEDCLLGLQGQPNVEVWGEPSGGGSGRLRRVRLLPGWRLTVTTSLTYDLRGRCVEGNGIPVDHLVVPDRRHPDGTDPVLLAADALW